MGTFIIILQLEEADWSCQPSATAPGTHLLLPGEHFRSQSGSKAGEVALHKDAGSNPRPCSEGGWKLKSQTAAATHAAFSPPVVVVGRCLIWYNL